MKKWIALALSAVMLMACTACGKKDEKMYDFELSKYVTLGTYKGVEVSKTEIEKSVADTIAADLKASAYDEEITDRAAEEGDKVNIDYTATVNDESFEGSSATDYNVTLGSDTIQITGIEDAVIGMNKGETKNIDVVLADDFSSTETDINGQTAKVSITLNKISKSVTPEEMTDEIAEKRSNGKYTTAADYEAGLRLDAKEEAVWTAVMNNITILDYPEAEAEKYYNTQVEAYEGYAQSYGLDLATYVSMMYQMEESAFLEEIANQSLMSAVSDVTMLLIYKAENLSYTDEEFNAYAEEFAQSNSLENAEAAIEKAGRDNLERGLQMEKVIELLVEAAVEVETEDTSDVSDTGAADTGTDTKEPASEDTTGEPEASDTEA